MLRRFHPRPIMAHRQAWRNREAVEAAVFDFINSRTFNPTDFKLERLPKPHIKFTSPLARDLAAHVLRRVSFTIIVKACRTVAELFYFSSTSPKRNSMS